MPIYIIVAKNKSPLGPNEINAGGKIQVADGDVFIFASTADKSTKFESSTGSAKNFEVRFEQSNANNLTVEFEKDLNPTINISDNVNLGRIFIKADKADSVTLNAGDRVTLDHYHGSKNGVDKFTAGDNFKMNDHLRTEGGDDVIRIGANASIPEVDGGKGNDTLITQTNPSALNSKNFENTHVVCFAAGTRIDTPGGPRPVEEIGPGDLVLTLDHGAQPVRWARAKPVPLDNRMRDKRNAPVRIRRGALGAGMPESEMIVTPQHRVLVAA